MKKNFLNKMPSIVQFKQIIREIKEDIKANTPDGDPFIMPITNVLGTVKLHGTNAGVTFCNDEIYAQSKINVITIDNDNAGFARFVKEREDIFREIIESCPYYKKGTTITLLGEWAGRGIQQGVGVSQLEKSFYIFGIKVGIDEHSRYFSTGNKIPNEYNSKGIYDIQQFGTCNVLIDFNDPMMSYNQMKEIALCIEEECPVAKHFGISGIGEGIVFHFVHNNKTYLFKMKGEKHAGKSKVKKMKIVDEEKLKHIKETLVHVLPEWRLEQMYQETFDTINGGLGDIKKTGEFIKNVIGDIIKEESEYVAEQGLTFKEINSKIADVSRTWFMEKLNTEDMG